MKKTYLNWDTKTVVDASDAETEKLYAGGYVFTRVDKGVMNKTRSFRIRLEEFSLSSENRRILRKTQDTELHPFPIPYKNYSWKIGKLAKEFYEKFGDGVFSANKIKEIVTDADKSNFNSFFVYSKAGAPVGYAICFETKNIIHYSYPFYEEDENEPSRGLGMMTRAIEWAKTSGKRYVYLGSLQRPSDTYKLQFSGGEWFDGEKWQTDTSALREILK